MTSVTTVTNPVVGKKPRPVACRHCGQAVPAGLLARASAEEVAFCCHGCEAAHALLADAGLDDFYRHREQEGAIQGRPAGTSESFEEFDNPTFESQHVQQLGPRTRRVEFKLEGIHCRACVWLLERLPHLEPAVLESRLNLHRESLTIVWDSHLARLSSIAGTLDRLGYRPHPKETAADEMAERVEQRRRLTEIAIAAALAGNLMLIAVALYAGWWTGMDPVVTTFFRWVSAILGIASIAGPGRTFFTHAWQGLRARVPNMDIPIALGLGAGAVAGVLNTITGWGEIYFDSLGMLVLLLLIGRWVQFRQHRRAALMIRRLYEVTPRRARRREKNGEAHWVPVSALKPGDVVQVLAGETIPADGIVISGRSTIDRSLLTGESIPMEIDIDRPVHAGMNNLESLLEIKVTAMGSESRLGKLIDLIEEATLRRTPIVRRADRMSGWFVSGVLVATIGTAIYWAWRGDAAYLDHAIALAIVSCPCALAMATPLSIAVAIGRAARSGLLVKGGDTLERLASAGTLWLDKTGTLTEGRSQVRSWVGEVETLSNVARLESQSSHPVARAIVAFAESRGVGIDLMPRPGDAGTVPAETRQAETGGISGISDGRRWRIGNLRFVANGVPIAPKWERWSRWVARQGCTPILVSRDSQVISGIAVGDRVRPEAAAVLGRFRRAGWKIGILSGDHPQVVASVARTLGVDSTMAWGGLAPEEKVARVRESAAEAKSDAPVMMVGDGMNDGAALAAADVGVSMQSSAEVSLETADVHLGREGLVPLIDLIAGARGTVRTIRIGLVVSLAYNLLAVSLAATGWINPLLAALLMPVSSLSVIGLALGGRGFRRPPSTFPTLERGNCPTVSGGV